MNTVMSQSDCVVIIPTYNEKENIEAIIKAVLGLSHQFDILVIDDNSPDGTAAIVKGLIPQCDNRLHILERSGKLGLGTAYIAGFKWALERNYEYIVEPVRDTTAGFVCWSAKVLRTIHLDEIKFKGYAFQIEMKFTAYKYGFKIVEVPIIFENRVLGTSKMNTSIFGEAVFGVINLKVCSWFKDYKRTE